MWGLVTVNVCDRVGVGNRVRVSDSVGVVTVEVSNRVGVRSRVSISDSVGVSDSRGK